MRTKLLSICSLMILLLSSCGSSKVNSLTYFEDLTDTVGGAIPVGDYQIRIVPDDELMITVTSLSPEATAQYNLPLVNPATRGAYEVQAQPVQQSYIVDKEGFIYFPVLGRIHAAGMTTDELTKFLVDKISSEVENPLVRVELMSFRVNVLGEVKDAGVQKVASKRYTLLDALAAAGDLTEYGQRENVLLIRSENGKLVYHRFNLNDSKSLASPYFFLKQNDVVIVEANNIKKDNSRYNQYNSYKISVISTVVSAASVIASLVIALTVK